MFKKLLTLFLVAMLLVPAAAFAAGKPDVAGGESEGKSLERHEAPSATPESDDEDGDAGSKSKGGRAKGTEREKSEDDGDDSGRTKDKSREVVKLQGEETGDEDSKAARKAERKLEKEERKAEKEALKAEKKALKAERKLEKEMRKAERKLRSDDTTITTEDSGTAEDSATPRARGIQRAAASIQANIDRMIEKFGDGTKQAQSALQRVLDKFNGWLEAMLGGGAQQSDDGRESDEDTSTPGSSEDTDTAGSDDDTSTPDADGDLDCDEDTETSGTVGS